MPYRMSDDDNQTGYWMCICSLIITLSLFFGLFFGLMYPEIYISNFTPTTCTILSTDVLYRYSCSKSCQSCTQTQSPYSCDSVIGFDQSLNPKQCLNGTSSQCPIQGQMCGNGYVCCITFCQTCTSVSCSNGKCSTTSYPCNCNCISSVSNNQCSVNCNILYTSILYVKYLVGHNSNLTTVNPDGTTTTINSDNSVTVSSSYHQDFGQSLNGATNFDNYYTSLKNFRCYYDPNNPYTVVLSIAYTPWKWAVFAIFGVLPLMAVFIAITHVFVTNQIVGNEETHDLYAAAITTTIWAGILIPLAMLLPIWSSTLLNSNEKMTVIIFVLLFVGFGNAPLGIIYLMQNGYSVIQSIFIYCFVVLFPLCIYLPVYLFANTIAGTILLCLTYGSLILVGCYWYCCRTFNCDTRAWIRRCNNTDPKEPSPVPNVPPPPSAPPQHEEYASESIPTVTYGRDGNGRTYQTSFPSYVPTYEMSQVTRPYDDIPTAQVVGEYQGRRSPTSERKLDLVLV